MTNLKARIIKNVTTHQIKTDKGRTVTVKSSDRYVTERITGNAMALAFARTVVGEEFGK